ncbi:MAG: M1 family aminopeptidase [Bryobacteraceae bacterium]
MLPAASPGDGVSRELARSRAARISDIHYELSAELTPGAAQMPGSIRISFDLNDAHDPVVLDFRDGSARDFTVNGVGVQAGTRDGHIILPGQYFSIGRNTVSIVFESAIAASGKAITRFQDRDDGSEYIYSLFVPMDASQAFPCFDQPDLKARFDFDAIAPEGWTIVSNTRVKSTSAAAAAGYRHIEFTQTLPISTYLFAFAAGPFRTIAGEGLRMFVRKSKYTRGTEEAAEVLGVTRAGVRHMAEYFHRTFPFPKYDLVLIPGFAFGGMEHAGATFLREESILFRTEPTAGDRIQRSALLLHETAHQWFGDLVTMRWFDDLWLKEGFAQYMAYETLATLHPSDEIWKRFYQSFKPSAYAIDATHGTTPIHQDIPNLKDAKSAYGAIVYAKAPGLLRQLAYMIGETAFRDGVRQFLEDHEFGNAEWSDLVQAYERASGKELKMWADAWIRQPGMPEVQVNWSCRGGRLDRVTLRQHDVLGNGSLWPIRTQVLVAYADAPPLRAPARLDLAQAELPDLAERPCPAWIFTNDHDYAYGRFMLDEQSRQAVEANIGSVENDFERSMLWGGLWDAVREAQMAPADYIRLAIRSLTSERDEALTQSLLARMVTAFQKYLSDKQRLALAADTETALAGRMQDAPALGLRILYYRAFRSVAGTPAALTRLKAMLAGKLAVPGLIVRPLDRWTMLTVLLAHGDPEAEALLHAEESRDATGDGRKYAYVARAGIPSATIKERYFADYLQNRSLPEDWVEQSLGSFNYWSQSGLTIPYLQRALSSLPQIKRERKIFFVLAWLNAFIGGQQTATSSQQVHQWLRTSGADPDLTRKVLEVVDELDRTVRIRLKFGG